MVSELIVAHLADNGVAPESLRRLWLHQANLNMNQLIARRVLGRDPFAPGSAQCARGIRQHEFRRFHHHLSQVQRRFEARRHGASVLLWRGLFGGQRNP
jgi:hypothetical protein